MNVGIKKQLVEAWESQDKDTQREVIFYLLANFEDSSLHPLLAHPLSHQQSATLHKEETVGEPQS